MPKLNLSETLKKFKQDLKPVQFIFTVCILASSFLSVVLAPKEPGLYISFWQLLPLALTIPFFLPFSKTQKIRQNKSQSVFLFSLLSFTALATDYILFAHAGIVLLAVCTLPSLLIWLFRFAIWNFRCIQSKECLWALLLSSIGWGLYAFAFPPLPLGPLAFVLLVPWFFVLFKQSTRAAIFATFWSGMLYNALNYYWLYNVMKVGPGGLILFGLFLLISYFSLYNVIAAALFIQAKKILICKKRLLLWLYPICFAGLEMTRTRGDFSFPWSHLGYALGNHLELLQTLSYIGIFGYTALILYSNLAIAYGIMRKKYLLCLMPLLILSVLWIHGKYVLSRPESAPFYEAPGTKSPTIALVQPSILQANKWSKAHFDSVTNKTFDMVQDSIQQSVDLIVLAETAIPDHIKHHPSVQNKLWNLAAVKNAPIVTGALDYKRLPPGKSPRRYEIYNAAFLFENNSAEEPKRYIKKHLVPFSERIPFDDVIPILNYVDFGQGNFVTGKETPVYKPFAWTPFICYDAIFGDLMREAIRHGSKLMVNITNDGWFGKSPASGQHLNLIRYRAIENGFPVARCANSGITAFIDQYGHYSERTELFTDRVLIQKIPLRTRDTLYTHIGDSLETFLLWFLLGYILTAVCIPKFKNPTTEKSPDF